MSGGLSPARKAFGNCFRRSFCHTRQMSNSCVDVVRKRDTEHFLASLLLPKSIRNLALAIRALNVELTSVRDAVRDTNTGLIRLQFWTDAVKSIESGSAKVPNHPVLQQINRHRALVDCQLLLNLIDSKRLFFIDQPFKTMDDVEEYSKDSFSSINVLLLKALAKSESADSNSISGHARHCAHQLGLAEGFVTLLRGLPHNASRRRVYLPSDLLLDHKVSTESVVRGKTSPEMLRVLEGVAARADEHLTNCRFRSKYLTKEEKLLFLPAVCVDSYLSRLHKVDCDVFHPSLQSKDNLLALKMYIKKFRRQF